MILVGNIDVATSGLEYASAKSFYQRVGGSELHTYNYYKSNCTSKLCRQ